MIGLIEFRNVSKTYENSGTKALSDVNIKIEKGEFVFIVGSSGAGKSTFLKLIMREEVPTTGSVIVNGYDLNEMKRRNIPYFRRTLGVVFQDFRLIPTMNVYDNVAFAMRVIGAKESEIRKRVPYVLGLVGLTSKSKSLPSQLSGGEQQRVALARALANNASLIIADEPTGNIDPEMSYEIVDLLNHINAEGATVVMVTHEHSLVKRFNRRVVRIDRGIVVADETDASSLPDIQQQIIPDKREGTYFSDPDSDLDFKYLMNTYGVDDSDKTVSPEALPDAEDSVKASFTESAPSESEEKAGDAE